MHSAQNGPCEHASTADASDSPMQITQSSLVIELTAGLQMQMQMQGE
jgi:hypothetical protein